MSDSPYTKWDADGNPYIDGRAAEKDLIAIENEVRESTEGPVAQMLLMDPKDRLTILAAVLNSEWLLKKVDDKLDEVADRIRAELVCCNALDTRDSNHSHQICYWGEASARLVEDYKGGPKKR